MRSLILLPLFAVLRTCQAFKSPDIYSFTQAATSSPGLGPDSLPPIAPSQSRCEIISKIANYLLTALRQAWIWCKVWVEHFPARLGRGSELVCTFLKAGTSIATNVFRLPLTLSLKTVGLQVNVMQSLNISSQCLNLLIYTSPSVDYRPSSADVRTLTSFVAKGGNLIFMSQVPTALLALAGVSTSTIDTAGARSMVQLTNAERPTVKALQGFDFADSYDINMPIFDSYTSTGLVNVGYKPANGAQVLGRYLVQKNGVDSADTSATNAAFVKFQPPDAKGYVYSFGFDLGYLYTLAQNEAGGYSPWYNGHYYPGYDIGTRVIKNIVASSAHFVSLWSVPYNKGLAFTTTWDIDTYVSYPHGQGIAAASVERGAAGNLNLHTKYVNDAYETAYFQYGVPYIYQITGFRAGPDGYPFIDFGTHTVSHSPNAAKFPFGTGDERFIKGTSDGYYPVIHQCGPQPGGTPTNGATCNHGGTSEFSFWTSGGSAAGEVRVSAYLIRHLLQDIFGTNYNLTTYRPGHLAWSKYQATLGVANGFIGGSSCAGNSHLTHLPFQVTHNREPFQELPYFEFPLQWSDGDGNMSSADFPGSDFRNQVTVIKQMARYGGHYNLLIHPSDALLDKIQIQRALHDAVRPFAYFFNQTGIAHWWTIRDRAIVDLTATANSSATMTVSLEGRVEGLTLQVPRNYAIQSASGSLSVCQQLSYDGSTNAVVLRNTAKGLHTLKFTVGKSNATVSNCPDFTPKAVGDSECIAWDVLVDDFLELYFYNKGVNLLLLQTVAMGLSINNVDGTLQLSATSAINSYYTEISRFCFDASIYTHLYFDMVAPAGSTFYVQLVSFDKGCNSEKPSATYLDVTNYAIADGTNRTVTIPLSDFKGQDMLNVRAIRIGNILPAQVPVYIDNIKIQKRCVTAPGEDFTPGLAIESFQNVDRWITGINDLFGQTDYNNSMTWAKLSELGKMQLLPSNSKSFFYTDTAVNGKNLDASTHTAVSLNVRGPSGGSFDVVMASGARSTSTVNTNSYATLSQNAFTNVTIPLSAFSGLDTSSVSRITLNNFKPNGGSSASNFTVRWISLIGGQKPTANTSTCRAAPGYVVLDFCDVSEFKNQTNALGAPFSDDKTMQTYSQTTSGYIDLTPRDPSSYFYSLLAKPNQCGTVNSSYDSVSLSISGPSGATADVGFKHGSGSCNTNVITSLVPVTFHTAQTQLTIPFSQFPALNQNYLQSFVMTNFSNRGSTYHVHSLSFVGKADSPGCALCSGTLLNTCNFGPGVPRTNRLMGLMTDESTLATYSVGSDGSLDLATQENAYWYSQFGTEQLGNVCYNADKLNATGVQLSVAAPAGTDFKVQMRWMTDEGCTLLSPASSVDITNYVNFTADSVYQLVQIPFSDFPGMNATRLNSIALSTFGPANVDVKVGCISLISVAAEVKPQTCTCPNSAWLNYCTGGTASRNAYSGVQSDDGTMTTAPALVNGALALKPASSGSYWYSLQNCADISSSTTLYLNVTAKAGTTFNVQLQSSGNKCADTKQLQKASVSSGSYGSMTGSPVVLSIPLSDYASANSAFNAKSLYAVILAGFSDVTSTYNIHCAYFSSGNTTAAANVRRTTHLLKHGLHGF
jgi:hypothetical protein